MPAGGCWSAARSRSRTPRGTQQSAWQHSSMRWRNGSVSTTIGGGEMAVLIHPRGLSKRDCHPRHVEEHSLTFACRPEFLTSTLNVDPDTLPEPLRSYAVGRDPAFYLRSFPFTASVRRDLKALLSRPSNGRFSQVRAQARSLDLIATILEILSGDMSESPRTRMTPRDIRSLEDRMACRELLRPGWIPDRRRPTLERADGHRGPAPVEAYGTTHRIPT